MRKWYFIFLLLVACTPEKIDSTENVAIFGLWQTDETPSITAVLADGAVEAAVPNLSLELEFPDGERVPFGFIGMEYVLQSERTPQPGEELQLLWYKEDAVATVSVTMPPAITNLIVTNDTLQSTELNKCSIGWSAAGLEYEFALSLDCVELAPQPLPWAPGNFSQLYSGPQVATQLVLQPSAFGFYGTHELRVTVLNEELRDVFFYDLSDIRGLVKQGPDNVSGGKGFVAGVSSERVVLEVQ